MSDNSNVVVEGLNNTQDVVTPNTSTNEVGGKTFTQAEVNEIISKSFFNR